MPPRNRQQRQPQGASATAEQAWAGVERLLQQLAAANSTPRDWSEAGMGVVALHSLISSVPRSAWPQWLLQKLAAAVAQGLTPAILGLSGQQPRAAVILEGNDQANPGQVVVILNVLCAAGELMCRLIEVLRALRDEDAPQLAAPEAELLRLFTTKTGILPNVGAACGHLAAFLTRHKVLQEQDTADQSKASSTYCFVGLVTGLLNLWLTIHRALPDTGLLSRAPAAVMQTVQPVIALAVVALQAYPGPAPARQPGASLPRSALAHAAEGAASMTAAAVAERTAAGDTASSDTLQAAMAAASAAAAAGPRPRQQAVPEEEMSPAWVYNTQCLRQVMDVAAALTAAVTNEVWSKAVGSPASGLKPDTPAPILQLLTQQQTKIFVVFNVLIVTAGLHMHRSGEGCLDIAAFPTTSRSTSSSRRRQQRQQAPQPPAQQQQGQGQGQQQPEVAPWHLKLEAVMGLKGCAELLQAHLHRTDGLDCLVALMCCVGATLATQGQAPMGPTSGRVMSNVSSTELVPAGFSSPLMLVMSELTQMESDLQLVLLALHLIQGMLSAEQQSLGSLIQPLAGSLASYVVQGVRTADSSKSWSALDEAGMDPQLMRGSMLEAVGNLMCVLLDPNIGAGDGTRTVCDMINKQPTATLSTFDALLRSRAESEAVDRVYIRRLQTYSDLHGRKFPELLRVLEHVIPCILADLSNGDPEPITSTAEALLSSPSGAGAALVGLLISAQKYALRALQKVPAASAWDVTAVATYEMLGLHVLTATAAGWPLVAKSAAQLSHLWPVIWAAATDAAAAAAAASDDYEGDAEDDSDYEDDVEPGTGFKLMHGDDAAAAAAASGSFLAYRLGPLLVPVVQLYARALLLLTRALLQPPEALSLGMAANHPVVAMWMERNRSQLKPEAVVAACYLTTQFLELLLPQLQEGDGAAASAANAAAADGSSSDAAVRAAAADGGSRTAAVIPADVMAQLQQQAAACSKALANIKAELDKKAKPPKRAVPKSCDELLQAVMKVFTMKASGSSSSSSSSGGATPVLQQLQQFAQYVLAQLPSKMCTNPHCVQLGMLSEKDLCEKRCGACKTAYCSKECSRQHWKQHKPLCQHLSAAAAAPAGPAGSTKTAAGQQS